MAPTFTTSDLVGVEPVANQIEDSQIATLQLVNIDSKKESNQPRRCHCRGGKCRQLYCVCLKAGVACDPTVCQCEDCQNDMRESAIAAREEQKRILKEAVRRGCNCKRNYCLKNYCICHSQGLKCIAGLCQCNQCFNFEGAGPPPTKQNSECAKGSDARKRRRNENKVSQKVEPPKQDR